MVVPSCSCTVSFSLVFVRAWFDTAWLKQFQTLLDSRSTKQCCLCANVEMALGQDEIDMRPLHSRSL